MLREDVSHPFFFFNDTATTEIYTLSLHDALPISSLTWVPETSVALGFGFRCGFLGLLHMEIIQERLRREYNMDIIATSPSVVYEILTTRGEVLHVDNPAHLPDPSIIEEIQIGRASCRERV